MARSAPHPASFNHITDAAPEYVDVILWHRVVLAVAALALAVAALGYGVFRLTTADDMPAPQLTSVALDELTQRAPPAAVPESKPAEPIGQAVEPVAVNVAVATALTTTETADAITEPDTAPQQGAPVASQPADKVVAAATDASRYKVHTTILVPAVKRAVLTDTMRGREPGPALTDTRHLSDQSTFSLYQFVDIRGKAGDTLIYHWKRDGKTVAKVRIPVGSDKWRNHSSKNFNQNLLGNWQVDVTNQNNILLVRSEFRLGD